VSLPGTLLCPGTQSNLPTSAKWEEVPANKRPYFNSSLACNLSPVRNGAEEMMARETIDGEPTTTGVAL